MRRLRARFGCGSPAAAGRRRCPSTGAAVWNGCCIAACCDGVCRTLRVASFATPGLGRAQCGAACPRRVTGEARSHAHVKPARQRTARSYALVGNTRKSTARSGLEAQARVGPRITAVGVVDCIAPFRFAFRLTGSPAAAAPLSGPQHGQCYIAQPHARLACRGDHARTHVYTPRVRR